MTMQSENLTVEAIRQSLATRIVGQKVLYYSSISSTMDIARQEAASGAPEGTVIVAGEQTAGRGRLRRTWMTPTGNVALSVVLYPRLSELPSLVMMAALAVARTVEMVADLKASVKWPNDVMIAGRKVCGILIEADARPSQEGRATHAIIGIGINVALDPADFPEIEPIATSLYSETGRHISRLAVIRGLLKELDRLYLSLQSGASLFEEWRDHLVTLGQMVTVTSIDATFEAFAESVEPDGTLLVRCADGSIKRVVAGDVTLKTK
jgi:BirA family biotin operon repressor/biotin-[acetyl-CoA-carboxylase] ligase